MPIDGVDIYLGNKGWKTVSSVQILRHDFHFKNSLMHLFNDDKLFLVLLITDRWSFFLKLLLIPNF